MRSRGESPGPTRSHAAHRLLPPSTQIADALESLYQMATGALPFQGNTSAVVFEAILDRDPVPVNQINAALPPELSRILDKALEKDRNRRYQTASEIKPDLIRLRRNPESGRKPPDRSIAVLYFENLSGVKEDEYFRDGTTEDISTEHSKTPISPS